MYLIPYNRIWLSSNSAWDYLKALFVYISISGKNSMLLRVSRNKKMISGKANLRLFPPIVRFWDVESSRSLNLIAPGARQQKRRLINRWSSSLPRSYAGDGDVGVPARRCNGERNSSLFPGSSWAWNRAQKLALAGDEDGEMQRRFTNPKDDTTATPPAVMVPDLLSFRSSLRKTSTAARQPIPFFFPLVICTREKPKQKWGKKKGLNVSTMQRERRWRAAVFTEELWTGKI